MISGIQKFFKLFGPTVSSTKIVALVAPFLSGVSNPTSQDNVQQTGQDSGLNAELFKRRAKAMLMAPLWQLSLGDDMRAKSKTSLQDREKNDFSFIEQEHFVHRFQQSKELLDDSFDSLDDISETESIRFELDRQTLTYKPIAGLQTAESQSTASF